MRIRVFLFLLCFIFIHTFSFGQAVVLRTPKNDQKYFCNAVRISKDRAIGVSHCILLENGSLVQKVLTIDNHTAYIDRANGQLALFYISPDIKEPIAKIAKVDEKNPCYLTQKYIANGTLHHLTRRVSTFVRAPFDDYPEWGQAAEGFIRGMSGSGLYNDRGELVGLVETIYGHFWNLETIRKFLRLE